MVHKKFVNPTSTRENTWIDRAPKASARNYLDEMAPINGFNEENAESLRLRDAFRDEVSKRMGELLLKGQTMLDEYCPTCSGILMEDRAGTRRCITCELYNEKLSQVVAEVPLQEEDLKEAVEKTPPPTEKKSVKKSTVVKTSAPKAPVKTVVEVKRTEETEESESPLEAAKEAVLRKIQWATAGLDSTSETVRVLELLTVLQKSAETLQALQI